ATLSQVFVPRRTASRVANRSRSNSPVCFSVEWQSRQNCLASRRISRSYSAESEANDTGSAAGVCVAVRMTSPHNGTANHSAAHGGPARALYAPQKYIMSPIGPPFGACCVSPSDKRPGRSRGKALSPAGQAKFRLASDVELIIGAAAMHRAELLDRIASHGGVPHPDGDTPHDCPQGLLPPASPTAPDTGVSSAGGSP